MPVPTVRLSGSALAGIYVSDPHAAIVASLPQTVHLGRIHPAARPMAPRLAAYMHAARGAAVVPPATLDYYSKAVAALQHMYLNDQYGDCVIADQYHSEGLRAANESGQVVTGTDQEVYAMYQGICGPGDNGCVITAVLDYARDKGLPFNGQVRKIDGYVQGDWTNQLEVQVGTVLFGTATLGINLPAAWQSSAVWDVTNTPIVGGHDVAVVGYNAQGVQVSSWGRVYTLTWAALRSTQWVEELYFVLAPSWYAKASVNPMGVDVATLRDDLTKLGAGTIPPLPSPPISPPPPVPPSPPVPSVPPVPIPPVPPVPPTPVPTSGPFSLTLTAPIQFRDGFRTATIPSHTVLQGTATFTPGVSGVQLGLGNGTILAQIRAALVAALGAAGIQVGNGQLIALAIQILVQYVTSGGTLTWQQIVQDVANGLKPKAGSGVSTESLGANLAGPWFGDLLPELGAQLAAEVLQELASYLVSLAP